MTTSFFSCQTKLIDARLFIDSTVLAIREFPLERNDKAGKRRNRPKRREAYERTSSFQKSIAGR